MRRSGVDGNLVTAGARPDPCHTAAQGHLAHLSGGCQTEHRVEGRGSGSWIRLESGDATPQPPAQDRGCERGIHDGGVGDHALEHIIVVPQTLAVAGEGVLDTGPAFAQRSQDGVAQPAARIPAGSVVFVDDNVVDGQRDQRVAQHGLRKTKERPDGDDAIDGRGYRGGRGPTPSPPEAREVQKDAFGDVAAVVGEDDGTERLIPGEGAQDGMAGAAEGGFIAPMGRDGADLGAQPERLGSSGHGGGLGGRSRTAAVVDGDDDEHPACSTGPARDGLEQRPRVRSAGDSEDRAARQWLRGVVVDGVERVPQRLQRPSHRRRHPSGATFVNHHRGRMAPARIPCPEPRGSPERRRSIS
jgi:hypothetical protein